MAIGTRKTTVSLSNTELNELNELIMDNLENAEVKIKVPRTEGAKPTASIEVSSAVLADALAAGLEMDVSELDDMSMSVKQDGSVELTY